MLKFFKMLGALVALMAAPQGKDAEIAKLLKDINDFLGGDEAKGFEGLPELKAQAVQLRRDIDAQAEAHRRLEKMGLRVRGGGVEVLGYREIMDLNRVGHVFRSSEKAEQFGAFVVRRMFGASPVYNDLIPQRTREMGESVVKDLDPTVAGSGVELVPNLFMGDLVANMEAVGILFPMCDRVPLATTGQTTWPKLTGELTAYPTAVAAQIQKSAPAFDTISMTPVKWAALSPVPNEFFRNPQLLAALGQRLALLIIRAMGYAFDNALVNGDGTAAYGGIMGIRNDATISAVTAAAHASLATYDGTDVSKVIAGMAKDYVTDPYWLMSLSSERTLRALKSTNGGPLYQQGANGEPNSIDGYPYKICQRFPAAAASTNSVKWGAFGDLRLAYYFGMLGGIEIAQSEHARFEQDVTVVRGMAHVDAALKDADAIVTAQCHA
jgi:HK97 family phage major capsid protein